MLKAYMKSETLKNAHTVSAKLFWLVPLVSIAVAVLFSGWNSRYYQMNQYNWWYVLFYPMLLLLSTAFAVQRERRMKNRVIGALPVDLKKLWAAKVAYIVKVLLIASAIVYCAWEIFSRLFASGGARGISSGAGFGAAILWVILSLWQIPLWLFINQIFGFGVGIILGLAGNVGLGVIGALEGWWLLNPFSYISRVMCPVLGILPNGLPAVPGSQTFFEGVLDRSVISAGVGMSVLLFIISYVLTAGWYQRKGDAGWEN